MAKVKCPNCGFKILFSDNNSIPDECPHCFSNLDPMMTWEFDYSEQIEDRHELTNSKAHGIRQGDKIILRGNKFSITGIISESIDKAVIYKIENESKQTFALKLYFEFSYQKEEPNFETLKRIKEVTDPNILKLHDFGVGADKYQGKYCYEISDFVEGGDLFAVTNFKEKYTKNFIETSIVPEILNGIKKLHEFKIYHCDLKPSNIFYKNSNQTDLLIGDYGSAKAFDLESESEAHITSYFSGTTVFMAPEQVRGIISEKNDYYSFGMILLYLLYPEHLSNDNNISQIDKRKFEKIVERQYNNKPIIDFNPAFKRLNTLIEGLTLFNHINRFGKGEVEKWLHGQENEVKHEAKTCCKICGNPIDYQNMPGFMLGADICLECNFKTQIKS